MRWYKRYGALFIDGTMSLSLEEKGAYSLCLDLIYSRGGPIPDDARWLAGICNVSLRKWASLRQRLIDLGKLHAEDGYLGNPRAASEIASAELSSRKLSESGAKGGRKRAEIEAAARKTNDLGKASLNHLRLDIEEEKKEESGGADAPSGKYVFEGRVIRLARRHFDEWRRDYHAIADLAAELRTLDGWWQDQPEEKQKKWFHPTMGMLNRKHQEILEKRKEETFNDSRSPNFRLTV